MAGEDQSAASIFDIKWRAGTVALAVVVMFAATIIAAPVAQAQTFTVLHYFSGGGDGAYPYAGLTVGPSGVLYGTALEGGNYNAGTVFKLSQVNSSWVFSPLYEFTGGGDGGTPAGGVVIGPNGALYGTTVHGGDNYGTVFELRPPATSCRAILCYWNETVLHAFTGQPADGDFPEVENLAFDSSGNIYGTTEKGGLHGAGITFELTPSDGGYTESILHNFGGAPDGEGPEGGVLLDTAGNVYGTTSLGGIGGYGMVYQLMPSSGGWLKNVLVTFYGTDGAYPYGNLIMDGSGNFYGSTYSGGQSEDGVVYKLAPSDGGFTYSALYTFSSQCEPFGGVAMDAAGHFFGVCYGGGAHQDGWIFELTNCSETCTLVDLHDFSGSDGFEPYGSPALDANGNLYGTTVFGGTGCDSGCGVVWEITP
jgi:uncharacterized repeat protein (TIGR03803 family)